MGQARCQMIGLSHPIYSLKSPERARTITPHFIAEESKDTEQLNKWHDLPTVPEEPGMVDCLPCGRYHIKFFMCFISFNYHIKAYQIDAFIILILQKKKLR